MMEASPNRYSDLWSCSDNGAGQQGQWHWHKEGIDSSTVCGLPSFDGHGRLHRGLPSGEIEFCNECQNEWNEEKDMTHRERYRFIDAWCARSLRMGLHPQLIESFRIDFERRMKRQVAFGQVQAMMGPLPHRTRRVVSSRSFTESLDRFKQAHAKLKQQCEAHRASLAASEACGVWLVAPGFYGSFLESQR